MKNCTFQDFEIGLTAQKVNGFGLYHSCVSDKSRRYFMLTRLLEGGGIGDNCRVLNFFGVCSKDPNFSEESIRSIFDGVFDQLVNADGSAPKLAPMKIYKFPDYLEGRITPFSSFSFYFLLVLALILLFAVFSTTMVKGLRVRLWEQAEDDLYEERLDRKEEASKIEKVVKKSVWSHFDLVSNLRKITSPPKFADPISQTFTIARPLSSILIIFFHEITFKRDLSNLYGHNYEDWTNFENTSKIATLAQMGQYAVRIFFFMGGYVSIIASESFYKKAKKANRNPILTYFYMILRRYFRFAPTVLLLMLYMIKVVTDLGTSPFTSVDKQRSGDLNELKHVLWYMFFFIRKLIVPAWAWYIRADLDLYMVMVLVVMLTKTPWKRNCLIVGLVILGMISYALMIYSTYKDSGVINTDHYGWFFPSLMLYFSGALLCYNLKLSQGEKEKGVEGGVEELIEEGSQQNQRFSEMTEVKVNGKKLWGRGRLLMKEDEDQGKIFSRFYFFILHFFPNFQVKSVLIIFRPRREGRTASEPERSNSPD